MSLFKIWSASSPIVGNNCVDDYCASKYYQPKYTKRKCRVSQESVTFVNVCSDKIVPQLRHLTQDDCTSSCSRFDTVCLEKKFRKGFKGSNKSDTSNSRIVWDNGRDWNNPKTKEGGWIRIYPFMEQKLIENIENESRGSPGELRTVEREIKNSVLAIQK